MKLYKWYTFGIISISWEDLLLLLLIAIHFAYKIFMRSEHELWGGGHGSLKYMYCLLYHKISQIFTGFDHMTIQIVFRHYQIMTWDHWILYELNFWIAKVCRVKNPFYICQPKCLSSHLIFRHLEMKTSYFL